MSRPSQRLIDMRITAVFIRGLVANAVTRCFRPRQASVMVLGPSSRKARCTIMQNKRTKTMGPS